MEFPKAERNRAIVESKTQVTPTVYMVTFVLEKPCTFLAGQTFMMVLPTGERRTMSIASPPSAKSLLLLCHDTAPGGPASLWTRGCKHGDAIDIMVPTGRFVLDKESMRSKIFVATGSGIAPFHSMVLDYLTTGGSDDVTVYWGVRREEDLYWQDEMTELSRLYPNFRFEMILSRPSDSWQGKKGHVTEHVLSLEQNIRNCDVYLCGNQQMIADMQKALLEKGVPQIQIKRESFY